MYSFEGYNSDGLGVAAAPVAVIGTAVANVGVTAYHAAKISKLQKGFQEKLENDQQKINYINACFKFLFLRDFIFKKKQ